MRLLICPDRPNIKWCKASGGIYEESECIYKASFQDKIIDDVESTGLPGAVGYMLFNGGEEITKTMSRVTAEIVSKAERSEKYLPEDNAVTARMLKIFRKKYPDIPHYLFCDTGYFSKLPMEASTYAVPYEFTKQGVRKYGSNGLCHDWISERIKRVPGCSGINKIVSIFVAGRTNVAAILNGAPVETSAGFTPVEGIPSLNGCGDLDPTIIFQLHSAGLKFGDINRILTNESGFSGLLGRPCTLLDIVGTGGPRELDALRDIYYYNVIKHIGYSMALMGGADAVSICCEDRETAGTFAESLCARLEYPALKIKSEAESLDGVENITGKGSGTGVFVSIYDQWKIMDEKIGSEIGPDQQ